MKPALLGGKPAFPGGRPFTRPTLPPYSAVEDRFREVFRSGILTKGPYLRQLEEALAGFLEVEHVVGVSSCTSGMVLALQSLGLTGEVLVPSFSFSATFHALRWNGLVPVFVDCEPDTFTIDLESARQAVGPRTCAVMGVCVFGNPPDLPGLEAFAREHGLALFFDSAHGVGTTFEGRYLGGWGAFEAFSLSPTKVLATAEGGFVATRHPEVARWVTDGREYGHPGEYDARFPGLNARLSEFHAVVALAGLPSLKSRVEARNRLAEAYREVLGGLPGVSFQRIRPGARSSYKDFAVLLDEEAFGLSRDELARALEEEGIPTRTYFEPPGHRQTAYRGLTSRPLPVTEAICRRILCLPIASHMEASEVQAVGDAVVRIHRHAGEVVAALRRAGGDP